MTANAIAHRVAIVEGDITGQQVDAKVNAAPEKQDAQVVDNQGNVLVLFLGSLRPAGRGWSANASLLGGAVEPECSV